MYNVLLTLESPYNLERLSWLSLSCSLSLSLTLSLFLSLSAPVYSELSSTGHFEQMSQNVDEEEHSIEMHLPYVAKVMEAQRDRYTIVPILVGALSEEKEVFYGKLLSKYLADPDNLFVISSDFCHWGERRQKQCRVACTCTCNGQCIMYVAACIYNMYLWDLYFW